MASDQNTSIPRVPLQTPMFDAEGNLTRTWIIFFERNFLGKRAGGTSTTVNTSSAGDNFERFVFGLGTVNEIATGTSATPKITVERKCKLLQWRVTANVAPAGNKILIDIMRNGASIFPASLASKILLPDASLEAIGTVFLTTPLVLNVGDKLLPDVLQVGTTTPGFRIQVQIVGQVIS